MNKTQDPEAAETAQTTSIPAVDLPRLVRDFCVGQKWAARAWKDQPHIKPLFDFANAKGDSQSPAKNL